MKRRDFIKIGTLSLAGSQLNWGNAEAEEKHGNNRAIIWIWLGGGPSGQDTFNINVDAPEGYESVHGHVEKNGIILGGLFTNLIQHSDKINLIHSFGHKDASHLHATHYVMDGHFNPDRADTSNQKYPSHGSLVSYLNGASTNKGIPTYVRQGRIEGEDPLWLGGQFKPFDPSNKENLSPRIEELHFVNRGNLLKDLDRRSIENEQAKSLSNFQKQAFDTILGQAKNAFNLDKESEDTKTKYGKGLGEQLLLARRLVEAGSKFITVHFGGWDQHSSIFEALKGTVTPLDYTLSVLVKDLYDRGLDKQVMIVVTGEFSRTKINNTKGKDHWSQITPLMFIGGPYATGRVIGKMDKQAYTPTENPFTPADLQHTLFDYFNLSKTVTKIDESGRPRYLFDHLDSKNILL